MATRPHQLRLAALRDHVADLAACRACPEMIGPPVAPPALLSPVMLIGQAPGIHEAPLGRPFAWTAVKTLFSWFSGLGVDEDAFRRNVYMAAVARCFPGKDTKGSDRVPDVTEIGRCAHHLETEIGLVRPELVLPVGKLAIAQIVPDARQLADVVGRQFRGAYHGRTVDIIPLPHPSGASTWHRMEPGKTLLATALATIAAHPAWQQILVRARPPAQARARQKAGRR